MESFFCHPFLDNYTDAYFCSLSGQWLWIYIIYSTFAVKRRPIDELGKYEFKNLKRGPFEIQHPKFETSSTGLIESVHERY